ncbi:MAG TPA: DUF2934 domain-containing protein [Gammaproteobacteria bacterium]|nr:DUF2934 domain-containing protein [Gammaproteobacteria bacterium]
MTSGSKKKTSAKVPARKKVTKKTAASAKEVSTKSVSRKSVDSTRETPAKKVVKKAAISTKKAPAKKAARKSTIPAKPQASSINISSEERWKMIAIAAYHRAEKRGFAPGHELQDWAEAEQEVDELLMSS